MARIRARLKEFKSVDQAVNKTIAFMKKWKSTETLVESYIQAKDDKKITGTFFTLSSQNKETIRVKSCQGKKRV